MSFLSFFLGVLTAYCLLVLAFKVRRNVDTVGTVSGKVKVQKPVLRTDKEEAELEEELDAGQ